MDTGTVPTIFSSQVASFLTASSISTRCQLFVSTFFLDSLLRSTLHRALRLYPCQRDQQRQLRYTPTPISVNVCIEGRVRPRCRLESVVAYIHEYAVDREKPEVTYSFYGRRAPSRFVRQPDYVPAARAAFEA